MNMIEILKQRGKSVEVFISKYIISENIPNRLRDSMRYSLEAGGKRLRPVLCLTSAMLFESDVEKILPFASAIEMIHTYSLIHDDLPAMDDDDLRRGKPSNHKAFDEATAILAGDGLLTDAFGLMCMADVPPATLVEAIREFALAAGSSGMVGGQALDMMYTGGAAISFDDLKEMHAMKTGALIRASCLCGAILAGADGEGRRHVADFGRELGIAFQIVDDILDIVSDTATLGKPAGSDIEKRKNTYPALLGLEESKSLACSHAEAAKASLAAFSGHDADFLRALADMTVQRVA